MLAEILAAFAPDWEADGDDLLICPCGHLVELDGECPEGHESPLKGAGMI